MYAQPNHRSKTLRPISIYHVLLREEFVIGLLGGLINLLINFADPSYKDVLALVGSHSSLCLVYSLDVGGIWEPLLFFCFGGQKDSFQNSKLTWASAHLWGDVLA